MKKNLLIICILAIALSACKKDIKEIDNVPLDVKTAPNSNSSLNLRTTPTAIGDCVINSFDGLEYTGPSDAALEILKQKAILQSDYVKIIPGRVGLSDILYAIGYQNGVSDAQTYINQLTLALPEMGMGAGEMCGTILTFKIIDVNSPGLEKNVTENYSLKTGEYKSGVGLAMKCSGSTGWVLIRKLLRESCDPGLYRTQLRFNNSFGGRTNAQLSYDAGKYDGYSFTCNTEPINAF